MSKILFILPLLCFGVCLSAQEVDSSLISLPKVNDQVKLAEDDSSETQDSIPNFIVAPGDTTKARIEEVEVDTIIGFFNIFKGEPGRAALYSLIAPGGGQIYNRRPVKAGLAILADATAVGVAIYWSREFNMWTDQYRLFLDEGIPVNGFITDISTLERQRNTLRQYRDYSWAAVGVVHLITVVEAFVDRHLLEFDMDEDLTLEMFSIKDPYSVTLASVNYTF